MAEEGPMKVFVGNLPLDATTGDIDLVLKSADISEEEMRLFNIYMVRDRATDTFKGFAYIEVSTKEQLDKILNMNGAEFDGRILKIDNKTGRGGGNAELRRGERWDDDKREEWRNVLKAVKDDDFKTVMKMRRMNEGIVSTSGENDRKTMLHWAAESGSKSVCRYLLEFGPPLINELDIEGNQPLHLASLCGYDDVVRLLLDAGASPTVENCEKQTPSDLASSVKIDILLMMKRYSIEDEQEDMENEEVPPLPKQDMTLAELRKYDGVQDEHILFGLNGTIYDVTRGRSWRSLAGHDATRALGTMGEKAVKEEWDDCTDLTPGERESADKWESSFKFKYPIVGKVVKDVSDKTTYPEGEMSKIQDCVLPGKEKAN